MKKLFLLLAFLCFQMSSAQLQVPVAEPAFKVESPVVLEAYKKLVDRAAAHGKDLPATLESRISTIQVVPIIPCEDHKAHPEGDLGMVIPGDRYVVVLSQLSVKDTTSLEWNLAHELGHVLGFDHTSEPLEDGTYAWQVEIMSGAGPSDSSHLLYQLMNHPVYSIDMWENYFNQPQFLDLR